MTVRDLLHRSIELLKARGIDSAKLDAEILVSTALGWERTDLITNSFHILEKDERSKCIDWIDRRQAGEPVAYIVGTRGFFKEDFVVSPDVLIPRPETELVVECALDWIGTNHVEGKFRIVDLGAGSGCIGLSLAKEVPNSKVFSVDISLSALEILKINAERLGVLDQVSIWDGDAGNLDSSIVVENLGGNPHIVVANPPYIAINDPKVDAAVKKYEPHTALFSGVDGLEAIRAWARTAGEILVPSGIAVFEIGTEQGEQTKELFNSLPFFEEVLLLKDLAGHDRVVTARKRT